MFQDLFNDLPDGSCWIDGKRFKDLAQRLDADRFQFAQGPLAFEIPTPNGRFGVIHSISSSVATRPWSIAVRNFSTTDSPDWKFIVYRGSRLEDPDDGFNEIPVDGIAGAYVPAEDDTGWHSFSVSSEGIRVWIELAFDTTDANWGDVTAADLRWDGGGGTWGGGRFEYINTGSGDSADYAQSKARKIIGQIFDRDGHGIPYVDQWVDTHLTLAYTGGEALDSGGGTPKKTALRYIYPLG